MRVTVARRGEEPPPSMATLVCLSSPLPHNQPADLTELTYFNLPLAHSTILLLFYADPAKRDLWPH